MTDAYARARRTATTGRLGNRFPDAMQHSLFIRYLQR
jgi:hypothetical protein